MMIGADDGVNIGSYQEEKYGAKAYSMVGIGRIPQAKTPNFHVFSQFLLFVEIF